jgi:nucleotide-binding universal stress UspA family protein
MQLLRKCPCPVWLVGASSSRRPARILAAIDASCNDPGEAELNRSIIAHARAIQSAEEASLTVAYAWEPFGLDVLRHRMNADDFHAFVESARAAAASDVEAFVTSLSDRQNVVLLNGEPHDAIAQYADDAGVDLVVLGTVGRSGFAGAVMGNTAERILSKIRGSVLAIKPEGFVSPIS